MTALSNDQLIKMISAQLRKISSKHKIDSNQMAGAIASITATFMQHTNTVSFNFGDKEISLTDNIGNRSDEMH